MRTQIFEEAMSGWNDGGRGERGNRRMFDPAEVSMVDEEVSDVERTFNPIRMELEEGDGAYFGGCGREIQTRVLSCLTS